MRLVHTLAAVAVASILSGVATARAQTQLIGDKDCYGFGGYPCPVYPDANLRSPDDRRSAAEAMATNGAQQTDYYSAVFPPLPTAFDVVFPLASPITSGLLTIGVGGLQATSFGQYTVSMNGVLQPNYFAFEDGPFGSVERSFVLDPVQIANANAANALLLTISRDASIDAVAFDYFQLDYRAAATTAPEPSPLLLLLGGLCLLGWPTVARRRRTG